MARDLTALGRLRGALLAAWLACAYGLALVAGTLATAAPAAPHPALAGAVLCSGSGQPADEPAPVLVHCTSCPLVQPTGLPPEPLFVAAPRRIVVATVAAPVTEGWSPGRPPGLPEARGPPHA